MAEQKKYYYQRGMCAALNYNSLNPVLYISPMENVEYKKKNMVCNAIMKGKCNNAENCKLLQDAPDSLPYGSIELYSKKIGE